MTRRRGLVAGVTVAIVIAVLALGVRFGPALVFSLALALPSTESWLAWTAVEPAREQVEIATPAGPLQADLYRPPAPRGALVLVHGLSRAGRRHPELMRLARLLGRHGQLVLVPEFEGLAAFHLGGREVNEIRSALQHLSKLSAHVGVAGFSFGAGPTLVAAAEEPGLVVVGSFGGYADLRHVIAFITTGVHTFGGRRHVDRQEEYNRWKLLSLLVGFVEVPRDRDLLRTIAEAKLVNPMQPTEGLEHDLGDEGRAMLALARNQREDDVPMLLSRLPARAREALDLLSPLSVVPRLPGRLLIAHGVADNSIPFTESLRLAAAARGPARVAILGTFHHTGPAPFWRSIAERAEDGWNLFRLADELLTAR